MGADGKEHLRNQLEMQPYPVLDTAMQEGYAILIGHNPIVQKMEAILLNGNARVYRGRGHSVEHALDDLAFDYVEKGNPDRPTAEPKLPGVPDRILGQAKKVMFLSEGSPFPVPDRPQGYVIPFRVEKDKTFSEIYHGFLQSMRNTGQL